MISEEASTRFAIRSAISRDIRARYPCAASGAATSSVVSRIRKNVAARRTTQVKVVSLRIGSPVPGLKAQPVPRLRPTDSPPWLYVRDLSIHDRRYHVVCAHLPLELASTGTLSC